MNRVSKYLLFEFIVLLLVENLTLMELERMFIKTVRAVESSNFVCEIKETLSSVLRSNVII